MSRFVILWECPLKITPPMAFSLLLMTWTFFPPPLQSHAYTDKDSLQDWALGSSPQSPLPTPGHVLQEPSLARILNWFSQNSPLSASHHAQHLIGSLIARIPQVRSEHPGLPSARVLLGHFSQSTLPQTPNVSTWWFFHPLTYSTLPCGYKFPLFLVALGIEPSLSPTAKLHWSHPWIKTVCSLTSIMNNFSAIIHKRIYSIFKKPSQTFVF